MEIDTFKHIKSELDELELSLKQSISSDIQLATEVSSYIVNLGGKRIRPAITILVAKALDYKGNELIELAKAIELLHTESIIHDDIIDDYVLTENISQLSSIDVSLQNISDLTGIEDFELNVKDNSESTYNATNIMIHI